MPNDAKLGLVVGVGLVIAVAVIFFRKEPGVAASLPPAVTATRSAVPIAGAPHALQRPTRAKPTAYAEESAPATANSGN